MGVSGNSQAAKSFQSFAVSEELLAKVVEAVKAGEKQARTSGNIQSFEVFYHGFRQNIAIGRIYVIPPSVCSDRRDFPTALLYGCLVRTFGGEEMGDLIEQKIGETEFDEYSQADFDSIKEKLFGIGGDKYAALILFAPSWSNKRDYIAFHYTNDEAKLKNNLRHQVFACYFDPRLSSAFEALTTNVNTTKVDVTDITPKLNFPFLAENLLTTYPDLQKQAGNKKRIALTRRTADAITQEALDPQELNVFESLDQALTEAIMPGTTSVEDAGEASEGGFTAPDPQNEVPRLASKDQNTWEVTIRKGDKTRKEQVKGEAYKDAEKKVQLAKGENIASMTLASAKEAAVLCPKCETPMKKGPDGQYECGVCKSKMGGEKTADWSMKCPNCQNMAAKSSPEGEYKCPQCGWASSHGAATVDPNPEMHPGMHAQAGAADIALDPKKYPAKPGAPAAQPGMKCETCGKPGDSKVCDACRDHYNTRVSGKKEACAPHETPFTNVGPGTEAHAQQEGMVKSVKEQVEKKEGEAPIGIAIDENGVPRSEAEQQKKADWNAFTKVAAVLQVAVGWPSFESWLKKQGGIENLIHNYDAWQYFADEVSDDEPEDVDAAIIEAGYNHFGQHYNEYIRQYRSLNFPLAVYREIYMEDIRNLKTKCVGVYWSWSIGAAQSHWATGSGQNFLIKAVVAKSSDVNWDATLHANLHPSIGEDEQEITIKNGARIALVGYQIDTEEGYQQDKNWKPLKQKVVTASTGEYIGNCTPDSKKDKIHPGNLKDADVIASIDEKKWGTVTIPLKFAADYVAQHIAAELDDTSEVISPKGKKARVEQEAKLAKNRQKQADVALDIDSIWAEITEDMGPAPEITLPGDGGASVDGGSESAPSRPRKSDMGKMPESMTSDKPEKEKAMSDSEAESQEDSTPEPKAEPKEDEEKWHVSAKYADFVDDAQEELDLVPAGRQRVSCNQCQMLSINGTPCHETGCPNEKKDWDAERQDWVRHFKCYECGDEVSEEDAERHAEEHQQDYFEPEPETEMGRSAEGEDYFESEQHRGSAKKADTADNPYNMKDGTGAPEDKKNAEKPDTSGPEMKNTAALKDAAPKDAVRCSNCKKMVPKGHSCPIGEGKVVPKKADAVQPDVAKAKAEVVSPDTVDNDIKQPTESVCNAAHKNADDVSSDVSEAKSELDHGAKSELTDNSDATKTVNPEHFASDDGAYEIVAQGEQKFPDAKWREEPQIVDHADDEMTAEYLVSEYAMAYGPTFNVWSRPTGSHTAAAGDDMPEEIPFNFGAGDLADIVMADDEGTDGTK